MCPLKVKYTLIIINVCLTNAWMDVDQTWYAPASGDPVERLNFSVDLIPGLGSFPLSLKVYSGQKNELAKTIFAV